jgi:hypothetical protein
MAKKWWYALGGYIAGSFFGLGVVLGFVRGRKR